MTDHDSETPDPVLAELFRAAAPAIADAGFSQRVLQRLERRARTRQAVLALAAAAGIALALVPASRLLLVCSQQVVVASLAWSDTLHDQIVRALPRPS